MERKKSVRRLDRPHFGGYVELERLIEINRDAIRAYEAKWEKKEACKAVIREVLKWSSYSPEEAIGLLQSAQFSFLQLAEDIREKEQQE